MNLRDYWHVIALQMPADMEENSQKISGKKWAAKKSLNKWRQHFYHTFVTAVSRSLQSALGLPKDTTSGMATTPVLEKLKKGTKSSPGIACEWVRMRVRMGANVSANDGQKCIDLNCRHLSRKGKRERERELRETDQNMSYLGGFQII